MCLLPLPWWNACLLLPSPGITVLWTAKSREQELRNRRSSPACYITSPLLGIKILSLGERSLHSVLHRIIMDRSVTHSAICSPILQEVNSSPASPIQGAQSADARSTTGMPRPVLVGLSNGRENDDENDLIYCCKSERWTTSTNSSSLHSFINLSLTESSSYFEKLVFHDHYNEEYEEQEIIWDDFGEIGKARSLVAFLCEDYTEFYDENVDDCVRKGGHYRYQCSDDGYEPSVGLLPFGLEVEGISKKEERQCLESARGKIFEAMNKVWEREHAVQAIESGTEMMMTRKSNTVTSRPSSSITLGMRQSKSMSELAPASEETGSEELAAMRSRTKIASLSLPLSSCTPASRDVEDFSVQDESQRHRNVGASRATAARADGRGRRSVSVMKNLKRFLISPRRIVTSLKLSHPEEHGEALPS